MSLSDVAEWDQLFKKRTDGGTEKGWADVQIYEIPDSGSSNTQIVFDNLPVANTPVIYAESVLDIPIVWSSSNPLFPYTASVSQLAPKQGYLSLIQGIRFQTASGEVIVNEQNSPWLVNQIRPKVEMTIDAAKSIAEEGCLQSDQFNNYVAPVRSAATGYTARSVFGGHFAGRQQLATDVNPAYFQSTANQTLNNLQSDIFNQSNRFRLGYGLSSAAKGSGTATAISLGGVSILTSTVTFNIQVNPATFLAPAIGASAASLKYLFASPNNPYSGTNPTLDAVGTSALTTVSTVNTQANNSTAIYDADWPVVQVTMTNGTISSCVLIKPGSGLMLIPASTNATQNVTLSLISGAYTMDGRQLSWSGTPPSIIVTIGNVNTSGSNNDYLVTMPRRGFGHQIPLLDAPVTSVNPFYNEGFDDRIHSFWNNTTLLQAGNGSTTYDIYLTHMIIRLKDLHDHFKQLYMPLLNFRFTLTLTLAAPINPNSDYYGMMLGSGIPQIAPPIMAIGLGTPSNGIPTSTSSVSGACRMLVKAVSFHSSQSQTYRMMLERGLSIPITHLEAEPYLLASNSTSQQISLTVTTSSINAKRVWIFGLPVGNPLLNINNNPNAQFTGLVGNSTSVRLPYNSINPVARFQSFSVLINQKPWINIQYQYDHQFWRHLVDQLRGGGDSWAESSTLSYDDFVKGIQLFYVTDLTRPGNRYNENEPIQISLNAQRTLDGLGTGSYAPIDLWCIIEKTSDIVYSINLAAASVKKTY